MNSIDNILDGDEGKLTRRKLIAAVAASTAFVAGCGEDTSATDSDAPSDNQPITITDTNDTATHRQTTETSTQTPENTTQHAPTDTPEETPSEDPDEPTETEQPTETDEPTDTQEPTETEEPTTTPQEDSLTLEEIYREQMIEAKPDGKQAVDQNWDHIQNQLDGNYSDDELPDLVEDLAMQIDGETRAENVATGLAYALHDKLGYSVDEIMVDARNIMTGAPQHTASVYTTPNPDTDNPETQVTTVFPWGKSEYEDRILKPNEQNPTNTEQTIIDAWSSDEPDGVSSIFDLDGAKKQIESTFGGKILDPDGWNSIDSENDDLILGYLMGGDDGKVSYEPAARQRIDEILDVQNINENPAEYGTEARRLIEDASVFFYSHVEGEDAYMQVNYDEEEFTFSSVDHETHEENIRENFPKYSDEN
ncbi:hypothetical protein HLRTI_001546 [Halorhabdus tiamatea SARL4B]|uniref:Uncharacterized protein n=1 Tax=Halorhabdus tiamatea SARL4B TaxID=1033806 RepID=S6CUN0_9EURY|nr:hypothetical protein [Halorhabdus tiamatea]ERJ06341.1 hypothetical protein HLRTI_001546 [Halorhabdus tiamatea SARL4B]CCQ34509.1 hypothetical protein HTIA_2401 [Halorhabdus tiamatea SARL4B]